MITYAMLYRILTEAEGRVAGNWPDDVKKRSAETVALVEERMQAEGLTRAQLKADYDLSILA